MATSVGDLAGRVRAALESGDLDAYGDLLDPDVCWGPPDDPDSGCHDRDEVLAWYRAARDRGMRATVTEVVAGADCLLVGLTVSGSPAADAQGGDFARWQVLSLKDGLVADIRGFDDRGLAATSAGIIH